MGLGSGYVSFLGVWLLIVRNNWRIEHTVSQASRLKHRQSLSCRRLSWRVCSAVVELIIFKKMIAKINEKKKNCLSKPR